MLDLLFISAVCKLCEQYANYPGFPQDNNQQNVILYPTMQHACPLISSVMNEL